MSCIITHAPHTAARTAPLPFRPPMLSRNQALNCRNEMFRVLRAGGNSLFRSPLSAREIAAIFGVSERTVQVGVAEAEAVRSAVREVTADESD